MSPLLFLLN